jgi:hypothetical protein
MTRLILAVATVLAILSAPAAGQVVKKGDNLVEVTVKAAGVDESEAVRMALRSAVETGAGTYIHSQSETRDFALVRDTVLARAAGFVQSHEVRKKTKLPDGTIEVEVVAVVSVKGIEDTWGVVTTMLKQVGRPKIMVLIDEKIGITRQESSTVQTRIENLLLKSGFLLVDREQLKAIDAKDLAAAAAEDSPARIQAIAKRFGAQLFITGTANSTAGQAKTVGGVSLHPYQADANIRCYRTDTAQLLASIPGSPTRGVDRVARSAAVKSLDLLAQQVAPVVTSNILTFWQDALAGRGEVQLHVEGVNFKQYVALKKALSKVKQVTDEPVAKFSNGVAEMSLQSDVNAEKLAEKLLEVLPELDITDVSQNVIKAGYKATE